jgi:4-hydroxybenzoate polyprenyltransferase
MSDIGWRDLAELVRAPAGLSVLGDTLVGATAARGAVGGRGVALSAASVCLYWAGMALNDYADADLDARERPERPIPSGRVSRAAALGVAAGLTAAGVGLAAAAGRASGLVAVGVAASVWTYDLAAKNTPLGPVSMALCRGLDVLLGAAGPEWRRALLPAAAVAAHTAAVTAVSRGEVSGGRAATATGAAAATLGVAATAVATAPRGRAGALAAATGYMAATLPTQLEAARAPDARRMRAATRGGILAFVPLQLSFVVGAGSVAATAVLTAATAVQQLLGRRRRRGDIT